MPRAGLTSERVVAEAAAVADEVGLERLTLAAVAQRLGVTVPSLYKHVRGMEGLRRELSVLGVRELTVVLSAATVGRAGRDALHGLATGYREYAKAHPGRITASVRAPDPEDTGHLAVAADALAVISAALVGYGITEADRVDAIRSLRAAMHGFVMLEIGGGFGLPQSVDDSYERLVDSLDAAFSRWATAAATSPG